MIIYSSNSCPACIRLKNYLEDKEINYKEVLLEDNPEEFIGIKALPTIKYKERIITGFNRKELNELIK